MAMVQPKSQKLRLLITHLGLLIFIAAIMFPLLMVIAISLREGNFATGSLIPENISWEHWKLALGFSVEHADGRVTPPPFPVLLWLWNSVKVATITAIGIVTLSTTCAYAFAACVSRQSNPAERDADFPDVPGGAVSGRAVCLV